MPARRTAQHQASRGHRTWHLLWALPLLAALVAGGLYLSRPTGPAAITGASDATPAAGSCTAGVTTARCARPSPAAAGPATTSPPGAGAAPAAGRRHVTAARHRRAPAASSKAPAPPPPASPAASSPAPTSRAPAAPAPSSPPAHGGRYGQAVAQVRTLINQARAAAGLAPYTVTAGLIRSASAHTQVMAAGCGLSHQCPGEPPLGTRETNAGVSWTAAGENIGEAGPVPGASTAIAQSAVGLTQDMLDEKPPDDGHRLNILSSAYHHVGIAVYVASSGTLWMTQDFSN